MARNDPMVHVRLSPELKAQIEAQAQAAARSVNAEIVQRLSESLSRESASGWIDETGAARVFGTMLGKFETLRGMAAIFLNALHEGAHEANLKAIMAAIALYSTEISQIAEESLNSYLSDHDAPKAVASLNRDIRQDHLPGFAKAWDLLLGENKNDEDT